MQETRYKNKSAYLLESETLRGVVIPKPGGKLASLVNKKTGFEYLVQRPGDVYKEQFYGGKFVEAECSGFDEMFPTIDECYYESRPWRGTRIPGHGELWSLPWRTVANSEKELILACRGVRFPYRLMKKISFADDQTLRYEYTLRNRSYFDFEYLWAAHMMVNLQEGTRIVLPRECQKAVSVLSHGSMKFGEAFTWPNFRDKEGNPYRADIIRPKSARAFEKFYFVEKMTNGRCALEYPDGNRLTVSFSTKNVPYLGLLVNEDSWDGLYNIIIEPCSAGFDRPDFAKKFGHVSVLPAEGEIKWELQIRVD